MGRAASSKARSRERHRAGPVSTCVLAVRFCSAAIHQQRLFRAACFTSPGAERPLGTRLCSLVGRAAHLSSFCNLLLQSETSSRKISHSTHDKPGSCRLGDRLGGRKAGDGGAGGRGGGPSARSITRGSGNLRSAQGGQTRRAQGRLGGRRVGRIFHVLLPHLHRARHNTVPQSTLSLSGDCRAQILQVSRSPISLSLADQLLAGRRRPDGGVTTHARNCDGQRA